MSPRDLHKLLRMEFQSGLLTGLGIGLIMGAVWWGHR